MRKQAILTLLATAFAVQMFCSPATASGQALQTIEEVEPNNMESEAQPLGGAAPITVSGAAQSSDSGSIIITFEGVGTDDIEDLFSVTLERQGNLVVDLPAASSDLDLYLFDANLIMNGFSNRVGLAGEQIRIARLPAGTYFIGVTIFDADPEGPADSPYLLLVEGNVIVREVEPNNLAAGPQRLFGTPPIVVTGRVDTADHGEVVINLGNGPADDFEDLFEVTIAAGADVTIDLTGAASDLALYLFDPGFRILGSSDAIGVADEQISVGGIPGGPYLIAVSIFDADPGGPPASDYRLTISTEQVTAVADRKDAAPAEFSLSQNYPNPFNPVTTIRYHLSKECQVVLTVFDLEGRLVATLINEHKPAGSHEVEFDSSGLSSGLYFYRLQAGGQSNAKRMTVVR